jgi:hypothetical protein
MLGFAPERFPAEPGGPRLREPMRTLAARANEALPPRLEGRAPRFTGHGSRTTLRGIRRDTQICGVQHSIPNQILIGRPKRLEIAATQTKQSSRLICNRYKNRGAFEARLDAVRVPPHSSRRLPSGLVVNRGDRFSCGRRAGYMKIGAALQIYGSQLLGIATTTSWSARPTGRKFRGTQNY